MLDANQLAAIESAMAEEHRKDREALLRLKRFLPQNGSTSRVGPVVIDREIELDDFSEEEDEPTTIIDKIEQVMHADPHKKWSVPLMLTYLKSMNFPLQAKKPAATVGLVFVKLARNRKSIVRVRRGSGRTPNLYRAIPREHQEDVSNSDSQNERAAS